LHLKETLLIEEIIINKRKRIFNLNNKNIERKKRDSKLITQRRDLMTFLLF